MIKPISVALGLVAAAAIAVHMRTVWDESADRASEAPSPAEPAQVADEAPGGGARAQEHEQAPQASARDAPAERAERDGERPSERAAPGVSTAQESDAERPQAARRGPAGPSWPEIAAVSTPESERMETEVLNFLSGRSGFGITSITDVRCDETNCRLEVTGLAEGTVPQLMRELMADERLSLTDAGFRFLDPALGFDAVEFRISYDAKTLAEVQSLTDSDS